MTISKRTSYNSARRFRQSQSFVGCTLNKEQIEQIQRNNAMSIEDAKKHLENMRKKTAENIARLT